MNLWRFDKEHIKEQAVKRFSSVADIEDELNRIYNTLIEHVPDDWRLARFSPGFIIRDIKTGITLVGTQKRMEKSASIVKSVETCLGQGGFSKEKIHKFVERHDSKQIASRPNLFIRPPSPDNEISRISLILARQYEKVNPSQTNSVYFRCHPLEKSGLRDCVIWIKWSPMNGDLEVGKTPPSNFHGEDFWRLEKV